MLAFVRSGTFHTSLAAISLTKFTYLNERYRPIPGVPVTMFGQYSMNMPAYHEILKASKNLLTKDCVSNYVTFVRSMTRAFFHDEELLTCNFEGAKGLQPLCPKRLESVMQFTRQYYPATMIRADKRDPDVPTIPNLINAALRHRRNDRNKRMKLQAENEW